MTQNTIVLCTLISESSVCGLWCGSGSPWCSCLKLEREEPHGTDSSGGGRCQSNYVSLGNEVAVSNIGIITL